MGSVKSMKSALSLIIISIFLSIGFQSFAGQQRDGNLIYVNTANKKAPFDGKSWNTAFNDLQDAIKASKSGNLIWVAKGTYYPTKNADRDIFFNLKDGIKLYGGFKGNETDIKQRDWKKNITTLSANIGDKKTNTDNSYHVVVGANDAVLDGFFVKDGYSLDAPSFSFPGKEADESGKAAEIHITPQHIFRGMDRGTGAGILLYQALTNVSNCVFENNIAGKGGGMYIMMAKDEPERKLYKGPAITDCKFINNYAYRRGGGVSIDLNSEPEFIRCEFINNKCEEKGGAMYNDFGAQSNLSHCLFAGNIGLSGSAMGNDGGYGGNIVHCTFVNNIATEVGPALYQGSGGSNNPTVTNCIIWGNICENDASSVYNFRFSHAQISFSCVEGGYPGVGNINENPMFVNLADGNFRLSDLSPCIDSGFGDVAKNYDIDLDGNPRFYDDEKCPNQLSALAFNRTRRGKGSPKGSPQGSPRGGPQKGPQKGSSGGGVLAAVDMGAYERQINSKAKPMDIIYVIAGQKTGSLDGSSWANAFSSFQDAVDKAYATGAEVWVAKGIYTPTDTLKREIPFFLREGVEVYGGFQGNEKKREERNPLMYVSVLSGDIGIKDYTEDNSYHVLIAANNALLDGATIANGNANAVGTPHYDQGGGLFISQRGIADASGGRRSGGLSLTFKNCIFSDNRAIHGGAVYCLDMCSAKFIHCTFTNNTAETAGAVYDVIAVESTYDNCYFIGNYAKYKGGAMYFDYGARPVIKDCKFEYNIAGAQGGAIATISRASQVENTIVKIDNTVFNNNQAGNQGGAIYNYDASFITLTDCQLLDNSAVNGAGAVATVFASETILNNCSVKGNTSVNGSNDFLEEIRSKNIINK